MAKSAVAKMDDNSVGGKIKAWPSKGKSFLSDVRTELRHVTTPSRKEVQATTLVVLIAVAFFGVYFAIVDSVISKAIDWLMHRF